MKPPRGRRVPALLIPLLMAGTLALEACGTGGPGVSARATPPDPPPIPQRKPPVPREAMIARQTAPAPEPKRETAPEPALAPVEVRREALPEAGDVHRIRPGETVYRISRLYGVPIRGLIDANGLTPPYSLAVGQDLEIVAPPSHEVRPGETVYGISRRYGVDMTALVRLNLIEAPYHISPGQKLLLPGGAVPAGGAPADSVAAAEGSAANGSAAPAPPAGVVIPARKPAPKSTAIPKAPPRESDTFLWPVTGRIVLGYGPKKDGLHNDGINIAAPRGAPVLAAENGVVAYAGNELRGFGNLLLIKHADGWMTAYAHNEAVLVRPGDRVRRGQIVARVGDSGSVARPQLHFEIRKGTRAVNPSRLLGPREAAKPS